MRKRFTIVLAIMVGLASLWFATSASPAKASPADDYVGPYFGNGNLPPGCIIDRSRENPDNICFHGKAGLNTLDSPKIDVAVLVPASPTAERDLRIMRQAAEAWEGGIHYLADEMGLDWLRDGVDFTISADVVSLTEGETPSTYPLYDPEIVIIASNPVGGIGIGVDPTYLTDSLGIYGENDTPCHEIDNPFSLDTWEGMPGYDGHHGDGGGYYVEDCGGAGGNVCFSVNGAIDPVPGVTDDFSLFDLVLHETGHCLTLGHVGDGAETPSWGPVPTTDIMAYSYDPPGQNKCVSTLNVEVFATRMSHYIDVDGDGAVTDSDHLEVNDAVGDGANGFQVQHPADHLYASSTGSAWDCPQPDLGTVPGEPTDWEPTPEETSSPVLTVDTPGHGAETADGHVHVGGTVDRIPFDAPPTETSASASDPEGDATSDLTDIQNIQVETSALEVTTTVKVKQLWPSGVTSLPQYSISIDGRQFDSKISESGTVITADHSMEAVLPSDWSSWDASANTVTFRIPRSYLADAKVTAPYDVFALSGYSSANKTWTIIQDDRAPDTDWVSVAAPDAATGSTASATGSTTEGSTVASTLDTVVLEQPDGNTFTVADSSAGALGNADHFTLDVPEKSDVELVLAWPDASDLDMTVTGAGSGSAATSNNPERTVLTGVSGQLDIAVDPYLIVGVPSTTYTLTATIVPTTTPGPGPGEPGPGGEPMASDEEVTVFVDGVEAGSQPVETGHGSDAFGIDVQVPVGSHEIRTVWTHDDEVLATDVRTVVHTAPQVDRDGDGVADADDNCVSTPNADQADLDQDGKGDVCDADIDGDGYSNDREAKAGTDPRDATSFPGKKKRTLGGR